MPLTIPRNVEMQQAARALYVPGVFGYKRVARELGIPRTTVARYCNPVSDEKSRASSRGAKQRRTGKCVDCNATTRYDGRRRNGPALRCIRCAAQRTGDMRRGSGPVQQALLAQLAQHGELTFTQIHTTLGITVNHAGPLLDRMMKNGQIVRLRRGVYGLESEGAAQS